MTAPMPRWIAPSDHHAWAISLLHQVGLGLILVPIRGEGIWRADQRRPVCSCRGCRKASTLTPDATDVVLHDDGLLKWKEPPHHGPGRMQSPFPAPGESFFVGERWYPDQGERPSPTGGDPISTYAPRYKANLTDELYEGERWRPARHMTEGDARLKFTVVSRKATQIRDLTDQDAARAWLLHDEDRHPCYYRGATRHFRGMNLYIGTDTHLQALEAMWPLLFDSPWLPGVWIWCVEVKRFEASDRV